MGYVNRTPQQTLITLGRVLLEPGHRVRALLPLLLLAGLRRRHRPRESDDDATRAAAAAGAGASSSESLSTMVPASLVLRIHEERRGPAAPSRGLRSRCGARARRSCEVTSLARNPPGDGQGENKRPRAVFQGPAYRATAPSTGAADASTDTVEADPMGTATAGVCAGLSTERRTASFFSCCEIFSTSALHAKKASRVPFLSRAARA